MKIRIYNHNFELPKTVRDKITNKILRSTSNTEFQFIDIFIKKEGEFFISTVNLSTDKVKLNAKNEDENIIKSVTKGISNIKQKIKNKK